MGPAGAVAVQRCGRAGQRTAQCFTRIWLAYSTPAVELLPVFEYDELEFQRRWAGRPQHPFDCSLQECCIVCHVGCSWPTEMVLDMPAVFGSAARQRLLTLHALICTLPQPCCSKNPRDHMVNVWGYSHLNFFAPMSRFGSGACSMMDGRLMATGDCWLLHPLNTRLPDRAAACGWLALAAG